MRSRIRSLRSRRRSASARAARDQHRERIAGAARADADADVVEARRRRAAPQLVVVEAQPAIAEALADPGLVVRAQVEDQHAAARAQRCARASASARAGSAA